MENTKYHIVGTVSKSNSKVMERGNIYTPNTHIIYLHDRSLSW